MAFTPLHVHTEYSLLDGSAKIKELVARAKELGMDSLAITDHGVMYGVIDFYTACMDAGIKPVIGCEVYVAPGSRFDREPGAGDERYYHLVLLAGNNTGYHNLMKIVSKGFTEGYYYRPRIDLEILKQYHEGIIALSACLAGEVARNLSRDMYEEACRAALAYRDIFGEGNFFLEMQDHGIPAQKKVNSYLMKMSDELGIPLVATNDSHYINAEDWEAHDILLCLQTGKKLSDENRLRYEGGQYYLKSEEEMRALFPFAPDAVKNTHEIAMRCNVEIKMHESHLPHFEVPEGYDSWSYLNKLCGEGLKKRYPEDNGSVRAQLDYELSVIKNMGFVDYFLIVWDFIHYAKQNGIAVGPGRGSAAGSVVSYCLEITNIDPVRYQLLFERFLNPERVSMPDIDVDFCFERRGEVIDYVTRKYGADRVVQIVTFGTLAARGVVRDVGRVMDLPYALCDQIAKTIPRELNITLKEAIAKSSDLRKLMEEDSRVAKLIEMAMRLEGLPRHASMHAAGVVIGPGPMDEYVPLSRSADGQITTQFTMTTIEKLGLLKMDFLGLRTLTVIRDALALLQKRGKRIDIQRIDMNDKNIYEYISTGKDEGIFQLESAGMKSFMKELSPRNLEDVIAGISLYRPGPMDFIPQYIKGKNDPRHVTYHCPQLEPILKPTYGCIVYQEQVMQIVRDLAGFTLGRSDTLRRAMSKKKQDVMIAERKNFVYGNEELDIPGCVANGIPAQVANQIYDEMLDFAKYAFNKSHAACYAVVAYQTAYLKYYYPVEFMAALMTSVIENPGKVTEYIDVCRSMGIKIMPPDINKGEWGFSVADKTILYGLSAIKGLGRSVIESITEERRNGGTFKNLSDFIKRLSTKEVNKRTVESLIMAGALDSLPGNRRQKMMVYASIMDDRNRRQKDGISGQMSLFDMMEPEQAAAFDIRFPDVEEFPKQELLSYEKSVLGIYVSGHPLDEDRSLLEANITARTSDFEVDEETGRAAVKDSQQVTLGGMVTDINMKLTRNNQNMAFVTIEDLWGSLELIFFPRDFEANRDKLFPESRLFFKGRVSMASDDDKGKLICGITVPVNALLGDIWLQFADKEAFDAGRETLQELRGELATVIYLKKERAIKRLPGRGFHDRKERNETVLAYNAAFGAENVGVVEKNLEELLKKGYTK